MQQREFVAGVGGVASGLRNHSPFVRIVSGPGVHRREFTHENSLTKCDCHETDHSGVASARLF
jgi:hypothetical protein